MGNKKRIIVWRTTQNCNMNCLFCSYSNDVIRQRDNANEADIARLIKVLGDYQKINGHEIMVSWIGGEPLLWDCLMTFSKELVLNHGIQVSTTTNGLLLSSESLREDILKYFYEIVVSIDGFENCNDRVRQYDGHYQHVIKAISELNRERYLTNSKLLIKVNTILMRENIGQFYEFCNMLAEIGVDEMTFNQLGGYDRPEFYQENRLLKVQVEQFVKDLPGLKDYFLKKGLIIHGSAHYLERILASTDERSIQVEECNPGSWFWFINENGFISPCSYTSYEYKYPINEIRTVDHIETVNAYFSQVRQANRSKWCDDCHCTQVYDKFE